MSSACRVTQDLHTFLSNQEAAERSYAYTRENKRDEVIDLADRLLKGLSMRCVKYWATYSLLTWADVHQDVIDAEDFCFIKDPVALENRYRNSAQYMIARALFDQDTAEELGFLK